MDVVKTLFEQIDKICKYVSIGLLSCCIAVSSFCIYYFNILNIYLIVSIYACSFSIGIFGKHIIMFFGRQYMKRKLSSSKYLKKIWSKLSDREKCMLVTMYENDCSVVESMTNPTILLLCDKGMIFQPTQLSDGFNVKYVMQPFAEKMVAENGVNEDSKS